MAEAVLQILLENLNSLIQGEIGLIMGVDKEVNKLSSTLTTIQAVLEDAEDKQLQDKAIRNWLRKLNDLSFEIDDILDECATEFAKLEYQKTRSRAFSIKKILYKRKIGRRVKQVTEKLDDVAAECTKFHLCKTDRSDLWRSKVRTARETGSVLNESHHVYGRDEEREKIVDILVNQVRDRDQLSVLPVIGMGGLGKTTFAQLVFNDKRVIEHFDVKLWVCVSDDFDPKTLIKAMIESTTRSGSASDLEHLDALQHRLFQELNQKRYLLVMDDVWNDDQEKWFKFKDLLSCGSKGSSVIVTTRLLNVANIMSTVPAHYLEGLSETDCWLLFKERAFGPEEREHAMLKDIGKQIVKKCAGVPLAAKALGGLLRFKRKRDEWLQVKESAIWDLPQEKTLILPALRLSYNHLPFELRHCFAYCAVFPKDSLIKKEELIYHWIAHGYISSNGTTGVEDIGNEICNELVLRSLFQNVKTVFAGKITFQMHDLVHDLAQSIMENKVPGPQAKLDSKPISNTNIRLVNLRSKYVSFPTRTVLDMDLSSIVQKFTRLRILKASFMHIKEVPSTIRNLKQLRYLDLSSNREIRTLPKSLCSLWNLKILNLNYCDNLVSLPKNMGRLINLRHLLLEGCGSLSQMPPKIGKLISLKTLSLFKVGEEICNQLGELQSLNLGGKLDIECLERVENHVDANKANLVAKQNLYHLGLHWQRSCSSGLREAMDEKVLAALEPHANVESLNIRGFEGKNFPLWMRSSTLQNLVRLRIEAPNSSSIPQVVGELPRLEYLELENLPIEYIVQNGVQGFNSMTPKFPVLKELELTSLPHLKSLFKVETGEVVFPNLRILRVSYCHVLTSLPHLSSVTELDCEGVIPTWLDKVDNLSSLEISIYKLSLFDFNTSRLPKESLENLKNLKCLKINGEAYNFLPDEGWQGLKSLRELVICGNETILCLPEWVSHFTNLEVLQLSYCEELVDIPEWIKNLHNLKDLRLWLLPKMLCLPSALQHLPSLQTLSLRDLPRLTSLPDWLGNFTSLGSLYIGDCSKLASFPACVQQMENLKYLDVRGCPELERRCKKGEGEDWHKIAHISKMHIGVNY